MRLTGVKGLKVVSRTSSFQFRDGAYDVREIGDATRCAPPRRGKRSQSRGSPAHQPCNSLLSKTATTCGRNVMTVRVEDIFAVQDEISQAIVDNLKIKLLGQRQQKLVKPPTYNFEAYNLYLQGRYHLNQRTGTGLAKSIECFEKAASEDCDYAQPYAGLAEAYVLEGTAGYLAKSPADVVLEGIGSGTNGDRER